MLTVRCWPIAMVALVIVAAAPTALAGDRTPVTYRTSHYVLVTDAGPDTLSGLASELEDFRDALAVLVPAATGVPLSDRPVRVQLFEDATDYHDHARAHAPALTENGGYYDGAGRTVVAHRRANPLQLVLHEIVHAAMGDVFGDHDYQRYKRLGWPVWFDEGFAEYASSRAREGGRLHVGAVHAARLATLVDAQARGQHMSLEALMAAGPDAFSGPTMHLWYAAAWGLVDLLLSEPDLRARLPEWVQWLRSGADGTTSFRAVFGDLAPLERRLRQRVVELAARQAPKAQRLARDGLLAWTEHGTARWVERAGVLHGRGDDGGWHYLTRPVHPTRGLSVRMQVQRQPGASVGVVLGHHGVDGYPYHTQLDLEADRTVLRAVAAVDRLEPVTQGARTLPEGAWASVWLAQRAGVLTLWIDGELVLSTRAAREAVSLFGLYVHGGAATFRELELSPAPAFAAGPAEAPPPLAR